MLIARYMPGRRQRLVLVSVMLLAISQFVPVAGAHALEQGGPPAPAPDAAAASLAPQPESQPPPALDAAPNPDPGLASPPAPRPGLIDALGNLFKDSADSVAAGLRGTGQRIQDLNKGTIETLTSLPMAGMATGRSLCPRSANGAPDCAAGAARLCAEKGYSAGRSLDTESAETCNPRIYLPGHQRKPGDCRTDTFVTRAACQ